MTSTHGMTTDQIRHAAPAVFADAAHESRSDRYLYIPTADIITRMEAEGFYVASVRQSGSRQGTSSDHTKHLVRFRHQDQVASTRVLGQVFPEVVLTNSHNGSSSYCLSAGLFRLVCLNGMTTGESYGQVNVRHTIGAQDRIIEGGFEVIEGAKRAAIQAEVMKSISLDRGEQMALANAAHQLRFEGTAQGEAIRPEALLQSRREADRERDLWTTFNVIQENAVRGGLRGFTERTPTAAPRRVRTREVKGIDQSQGLNRALWILAEGLAHMKAGGSVETIKR